MALNYGSIVSGLIFGSGSLWMLLHRGPTYVSGLIEGDWFLAVPLLSFAGSGVISVYLIWEGFRRKPQSGSGSSDETGKLPKDKWERIGRIAVYVVLAVLLWDLFAPKSLFYDLALPAALLVLVITLSIAAYRLWRARSR
jgi:hypothetical protein